MGCVVSQSGFIATCHPVMSSVQFVYKRSINTREKTKKKKCHFEEPAGAEIGGDASIRGRAKPYRDGSCVSSALLCGVDTVHMHAMYVFVWHVCVWVCVCW